MIRIPFRGAHGGAGALILLLAAGSPLLADPNHEAALKVLEFEIRRCAFQGILRADADADPMLLREGPIPGAVLARSWPLVTLGSGRRLNMPPLGRLMYLEENRDLLEKRGGAYLFQLWRYVGGLLGGAQGGQVDYLLAAQVPDKQEAYRALAEGLGKSLGVEPATYEEALPVVMASLREMARQGAENLRDWLDLFLSPIEADGLPVGPRIQALITWRDGVGNQAPDRDQLLELMPLLQAAMDEADKRVPASTVPLARRASEKPVKHAGAGAPASPDPGPASPARRSSEPGTPARSASDPAPATPAVAQSAAAGLMRPRPAQGRPAPAGATRGPGTPLPAGVLTFSPGERVERKVARTESKAAAAVELSPRPASPGAPRGLFRRLFGPGDAKATPARSTGACVGDAKATPARGAGAGAGAGAPAGSALARLSVSITCLEEGTSLVLEGDTSALSLVEHTGTGQPRDIALDGGVKAVALARDCSYQLNRWGSGSFQVNFQIHEAGAAPVSTGFAWTCQSGIAEIGPRAGQELPFHIQVAGGSLVIGAR